VVTIVWFRRDLRLADHPALAAAARAGAVVPVYIWAPDEEGDWPPGGASRWWLQQSLAALDGDLRARGSRLVLRRGPSREALLAVAEETGARAVAWSPLPEPGAVARDAQVERALRRHGLTVRQENAALLFAPSAIRGGEPYATFTPFWRACLAAPEPPPPLPAPRRLAAPPRWPRSERELDIAPRHPWTEKLARVWTPGEESAHRRLHGLLGKVPRYAEDAPHPARDGSSRLSPHLHHGEIGPRQIWHALRERGDEGTAAFRRELGWREFAQHTLLRQPVLPEQPCRPAFRRFGWQSSDGAFERWRRGRTGYPLVDAGMRELWATGWLPNRVRMVVASFLVKHLLVPWQDGERWFWDTLVDADLASNALNWQWVAGTGIDSAPFFRIFNPVVQSQKFDPRGEYIRRWVPELRHLEGTDVHQPWRSPLFAPAVYPAPMVDHGFARGRALALFSDLRGERSSAPVTRRASARSRRAPAP
jgi:deoxyribodipyrimidine photo-lyase